MSQTSDEIIKRLPSLPTPQLVAVIKHIIPNMKSEAAFNVFDAALGILSESSDRVPEEDFTALAAEIDSMLNTSELSNTDFNDTNAEQELWVLQMMTESTTVD